MRTHVLPCPRALAVAVTLMVLALAGCEQQTLPPRSSATWIAGHAAPAFDPDGPPDALRWAIERQLSQGLVERDSAGQLRAALADSIGCSRDSLTWTFRLRAGLRFTDGTPVGSADVRAALVGGLGRADHATRAWLLCAVQGVARVRSGRPLPALGVETPDERSVVVRLARSDRDLIAKLAVPGVSTPWKRRTGTWRDAVGTGPYHVGAEVAERSLTLVAGSPMAGPSALADTLHVRFVLGAARARAVMRLQHADLIWPLPPGTLAQALPQGWSLELRPTQPSRRLLLVLRADLPPLHRLEAREALARAINHEELVAGLGPGFEPFRRWLPGALSAYDWPRLDSPSDRQARLAQTGRASGRVAAQPESYHVVLAYDADLSGGEIARALQGQLAGAGHYAELRPLRGKDASEQALAAAAAQLQLVESQSPLPDAQAELAQFIMPLRGPAVGGFRTGWRTRDFDRWVALPEGSPGFDPDAAQRQLTRDRTVLPLALLSWRMAFRTGGRRPSVHPAYGPGWTAAGTQGRVARTR